MAFEVFLMQTTASPRPAQVEAEVRKAIAIEGGAIAADGTSVRTRGGAHFTLAGGDQFLVGELSSGLCRIVFKAARDTNSMVERGGADTTPLRMRGAKGAVPGFRIRVDTIANSHDLCVRLGRDLVAWNRFVSEEQAEGILGPNQEMLEPPASVGEEPHLSSDPSGVGARCQATAEPFERKAGWIVERSVLSRNSQYGVVWRADLHTPEYPDIHSRLICWKLPHSEKTMFEVRPLQMFDPTESVAPLEAELPSKAGAK